METIKIQGEKPKKTSPNKKKKPTNMLLRLSLLALFAALASATHAETKDWLGKEQLKFFLILSSFPFFSFFFPCVLFLHSIYLSTRACVSFFLGTVLTVFFTTFCDMKQFAATGSSASMVKLFLLSSLFFFFDLSFSFHLQLKHNIFFQHNVFRLR